MVNESNNGQDAVSRSIKPIDALSAHKITSGQVVVDLQTAVKELVENSIDAGATNIEIRFKDHGVESIEVIDNGSGIDSADYDAVGLKHHTSKLSSFADLEVVGTFGFRGEALSSLCALSGSVTITTATARDAPMGTVLELDQRGHVSSKSGRIARQKGTTVCINELFKPLPVRRKELARNAKREFGKALNLLTAYALVPCAQENGGVRLTCSQLPKGGRKTVQLHTDGTPSVRASVSALWGSKTGETLVELDLAFEVETEKAVLRRQGLAATDEQSKTVTVKGLISKFALNCGRSGADRQFFYINGRPCSPSKVQRAFNDVYKTFNATQSPVIIADFILPKNSLDLNVSPDKRTIFIHSEDNLVQALKVALEERFSSQRATYDVRDSRPQASQRVATAKADTSPRAGSPAEPLFLETDDNEVEEQPAPKQKSSGAQVVDDAHSGFGQPTLLTVGSSQDPLSTSISTTVPLGVTSASVQQPNRDSSPEAEADQENTPPLPTPRPATPPSSLTMTQFVSLAAEFESSQTAPPKTDPSVCAPQRRAPPTPIRNVQTPRVGSSTGPSTATRTGVSRGQLVLSTAGASWNLRPAPADDSPSRPLKRVRLDVHGNSRRSKQEFRSKMAAYALPGSQGAVRSGNDSSESESEEPGESDAPRELAESERKEVPMDVDVDVDVGIDDTAPPVIAEKEISPPNRPQPDSKSRVLEEVTAVSASSVKHKQPQFDDTTTSSSESTLPEFVRNAPIETIVLHCDENRLSARWATLSLPSAGGDDTTPVVNIQPLAVDADADELLSRVIQKSDFASMDVVGQFNLGFIIARRRTETADDLFIVDQHAADEKYNFENLQTTTRIESQPLLRPETLELTAADELLATEHMDVLRRNGFELQLQLDESEPAEGDGRRRLQLVALPTSKGTVFDIRDLEELLHLLRDAHPEQTVRCSKARAMFAMRACRMSVMVGMPLKHTQMTLVVRHMGTMDQPWNCPHGRPTMRHLADIGRVGTRRLQNKGVVWEEFG